MEILLLSGLFHDTGFTCFIYDHRIPQHGDSQDILESIQYPEDKLKLVLSTIDATRMPHAFTDKLGALLQDAICLPWQDWNWEERSDLLRKEQSAVDSKNFSDEDWVQQNLDFLSRQNTLQRSKRDDTMWQRQIIRILKEIEQ
jgi:hypothetical protein